MGNCTCGASRHAAEPWTDEGVLVSLVQDENGGVRTGGEVTITIARRRLEELMAKAAGGGEGMTGEKLLAGIVNASEVVDARHRRRWEPALQSIPEAVES